MHTRKQARTHFLLFLCCCSLFFFPFLFQSGRLFPYAQAVVLYVFKGLSWPKGWFQKLASPVLRLTIPHRDYFNFFPAKNGKKYIVFFTYIFYRRRRGENGTKNKLDTKFFSGAMVVKLRGG